MMRRFFGGVLLAVGILIAGLSGLCSLAALVNVGGGQEDLRMLGLIAVVGGIPFAVGGGLIWLGRTLMRGPKA